MNELRTHMHVDLQAHTYAGTPAYEHTDSQAHTHVHRPGL